MGIGHGHGHGQLGLGLGLGIAGGVGMGIGVHAGGGTHSVQVGRDGRDGRDGTAVSDSLSGKEASGLATLGTRRKVSRLNSIAILLSTCNP